MPAMARFYLSSDPEKVYLSEYINRIYDPCSGREGSIVSRMYEKICNSVAKGGDIVLTVSDVHGDLSSSNVHSVNDFEWCIIDWEGLKRREISYDMFVSLLWAERTYIPGTYWNWMNENLSRPKSKFIKLRMQMYIDWSKKQLGKSYTYENVRSKILTHFLIDINKRIKRYNIDNHKSFDGKSSIMDNDNSKWIKRLSVQLDKLNLIKT
jgi:hypothetical protein